jgi:hypothetical protein
MLSFRVFVKLQHRLPPPAAPSPNSFSSSMIQPHCFQTFTYSPAQRAKHISFPFNHFRTISIAAEGVPPLLPVWNSYPSLGHSHPPSFFSCTYRNPILQPLSFHIHPAMGYGGCSNVQTFNLQTIKRSSRPIAAQSLWCKNSQRREISSRSGETTPLPPVSKITRADIGTCPSDIPDLPRPGRGRKSCLGTTF